MMSKYIDKEKLLDSVYQNTPLIPSMAGMTAEAMRLKIAVLIDNFDSIDVVRCKDCKYCYEEGFVNVRNVCEKHYDFGNVDDNWFCADGERRDNE